MTAVRHIPGGQLEDVSRDEAIRLLRLGIVELAGPLDISGLPVDEQKAFVSAILNRPESAMLAPPENAMLPAAQPRKRGRPRKS